MKVTLTIALVFLTMVLSAQNSVIDSLQQIVSLQRHDSAEMRAYIELTYQFLRLDMDKGKQFAWQAASLALKRNDSYNESNIYTYLVTLHRSTGNLDSARYYLNKLEETARKYPSNIKLQSNFIQSAGLHYKNIGQYSKALPYLLEHLQIQPEENENRAGAMLNIGNTYILLGDYKNAVQYHLQSLRLFEKLGSKRGQSFCMQSLGNSYADLKQYTQAREYYKRSASLKEELHDTRGLINAWSGLGDVCRDLGDFKTAEHYYLSAINASRTIKLPADEARVLHQLGLMYKKMNALAEARDTMTKSLKLARAAGDSTLSASINSAIIGIDLLVKQQNQKEKSTEEILKKNLNTFISSGDRGGEADGYAKLSEYYALNNQFDKAFFNLKKYESLIDSVEGGTVLLQLKELEEQYKNDKREKEIELLKKDQELQKLELSRQHANTSIIIVALVSVILISIILINRYRVLNRTRRQVEMERMRNTIARDLHDDIGSTLSSINIISQMALNDANGSASHFQRIAQHSSSMMESMSDIVWSINPNNDSLEQVITKMKEFASEILDPLDIAYTFSGEENLSALKLDVSTRKNLFLIFKEAINNSAKYSSARAIAIDFKKENGNLSLHMQDNGKGFDAQAVSLGNGLRNMRERAINLRGKLDLTSSAEAGTAISLSFPIT